MKHLGFIFWGGFIAVLCFIVILNKDEILTNLHKLGVNLNPQLKRHVAEVVAEQQTRTAPPSAPLDAVPAPLQTEPAPDDPQTPPPVAPLPPDVLTPIVGADGAEARPRTVYFSALDQNGVISRAPVQRLVADTGAPLTATLYALLDGLTPDERGTRLISLIPESAELRSVSIQDGTAYIDFNEEFLYNPYGKDGYAAQIKQVVWTATEFPTVKRVQILIDGRKVSYLGENIWIGSALDRVSLPNF